MHTRPGLILSLTLLILLPGCGKNAETPSPSSPAVGESTEPAADASGVTRGRLGGELRPIVSRPVTGSARYPGLTIHIRGKFNGGLDGEGTNLPASTFPHPDLLGGRFEGTVTLPQGAEPLPPDGGVRDGADSYKYGSVSVDVISATGEVVQHISNGPDFLRKFDTHRDLQLNLGPSDGLPGVPDDLRIDLAGVFLPRDGAPPTADEVNQASLRAGSLVIIGPHPGTQWSLDVSTLEITAEPGSEY